MRQWIQSITWAAVASFTFVACGGDVADIDRTQPDRLEKSHFEGEWYMRSIVTGSDYNQSAIFEGLEGDMDRIRWVIDEYLLPTEATSSLRTQRAETRTLNSMVTHWRSIASSATST